MKKTEAMPHLKSAISSYFEPFQSAVPYIALLHEDVLKNFTKRDNHPEKNTMKVGR